MKQKSCAAEATTAGLSGFRALSGHFVGISRAKDPQLESHHHHHHHHHHDHHDHHDDHNQLLNYLHQYQCQDLKEKPGSIPSRFYSSTCPPTREDPLL